MSARADGRLSVRTDDGAAAYSGRVVCLRVAGNTASIGIVVDRITADGPGVPPAVGVEQLYDLVNGGAPGSEGDVIQGYPFDWFPATFCPFLGAGAHVERGQLRDARRDVLAQDGRTQARRPP